MVPTPLWRYRAPVLRALPALVLALCVLGCSEEPTDETPEGALTLFLAAMENSAHDPRALEEAYRLLCRESRQSLLERARLAGSLGGRDLEPWELIARGGYRQTFTPSRRRTRSAIDGETATVTARDADGDHSAEVQMRREDGHWRVVLTIPPSGR